jgi:RluA family pseudouridine synthase
MIRIVVSENDTGVRLDRFLRARLPLQPLSSIYRLIRRGDVRVNGNRSKENYRLVSGDTVEASLDSAELAAPSGTPRALRELSKTAFFRKNFHILYEDGAILACDKPGHVVVHSGSGHQGPDTVIAMVQSYLADSRQAAPLEAALVHRLDRDTSGVILVAKTKQAVRALHDSFRSGRTVKRYVAVCHGAPRALRGTIAVPLVTTHERNAGTKVRVASEGQEAITEYEVVRSEGGLSRLELVLRTGRTHQIRVHLAHCGCPIVGDVRYGNREKDSGLFAGRRIARRLYLHAYSITFPHPLTGRSCTITSPPPAEFSLVIDLGAAG